MNFLDSFFNYDLNFIIVGRTKKANKFDSPLRVFTIVFSLVLCG